MCLGIPARITAGETGHPDLAAVDMGGVTRVVNIALLDEPPQPGDWILVHMGFALSTMTAEEAADAMAALGAEREAEDQRPHAEKPHAEKPHAEKPTPGKPRAKAPTSSRPCSTPWTGKSPSAKPREVPNDRPGGAPRRPAHGHPGHGRPADVRPLCLPAERPWLLRPR